MRDRVNIEEALPGVWKTMYALAGAVSKTNLTPIQISLIKVRASQINSCAFCINMHTKEALKNGETQQRLFLLSAWRETQLFTAEEMSILAITEEVTLIHRNGVSEKTYKEATAFFSEETISQIIMNVVMINAWNRISVSTHTPIEG
jgi:AhpD family alkylhydroperoxidase